MPWRGFPNEAFKDRLHCGETVSVSGLFGGLSNEGDS